MKTYTIKETFDIVKGYREIVYEVGANSYEEAVDILKEYDAEPISIEDTIEECENIDYEKISEK